MFNHRLTRSCLFCLGPADGNWQWHFLIFLGLHSGGPSDPITSTGIYSLIFWHTESELNWNKGTSYRLHKAILVIVRQFAEKQHTQINCLTFGSLQVGHASLIRQIPAFANPCELLVSLFRSLWQRIFTLKNCVNIKNLEKKIPYVLIVTLKFR